MSTLPNRSKSRRLREAATKRRLFSAAQNCDYMATVQSQLDLLIAAVTNVHLQLQFLQVQPVTSTWEPIWEQIVTDVPECGSAQAAGHCDSNEPSPPTEAAPCDTSLRSASACGTKPDAPPIGREDAVASTMTAEETSSNAPRGEGEKPKFGNIMIRSTISRVVTELSESSKWRDLPENIKEETVKKLKEPYSGNTGALYTG